MNHDNTHQFNGSKWSGQEPDSIEVLLQRLQDNLLNPRFEQIQRLVYHLTGAIQPHQECDPHQRASRERRAA